MATRVENINLRLDAIAEELAAMGPCKAGGLPDAGGDPAQVEHIRYRLSLIEEQKGLLEILDEIANQDAREAFEITSEMSA